MTTTIDPLNMSDDLMQPNTLHSKEALTAQCAVNTHKSTRFQKQLEREEPQSYNQNKQTLSVLS